jgi:hypothetical protein
MGFVGSVRFNGGSIGSEIAVRAKSCNINAKQEMNPYEVVDGKIDNTLYQIGPRMVEGDCSFPLVHEGINNGTTKNCGEADATCTTNLVNRLWNIAAKRDQVGRLVYQFNVDVRYTDNTAYRYPNCLINSLRMTVTNQDVVNMNISVLGGANSTDDVRQPLSSERDSIFLAPARVVTWNDFRINVFVREEGIVLPGSFIRSFEVNLNNQAERFYTLNGRLSPQDITAKKRKIDGSLALMGFANKQFYDFIYNNQNRFTSRTKIQFGYTLGSSTLPYWATALWGVLFRIEEVEITNDLVETKVPYIALGDCENDYEAVELGTCNTSVDNGSNTFGGPTAPGYFRPLT